MSESAEDGPSGIKLTVEPSKKLLALLDELRAAPLGQPVSRVPSREEALLALAAGGAATMRLLGMVAKIGRDAK